MYCILCSNVTNSLVKANDDTCHFFECLKSNNSDIPAFAEFLVQEEIDSISYNPDALIKGIENMNRAEHKKK